MKRTVAFFKFMNTPKMISTAILFFIISLHFYCNR